MHSLRKINVPLFIRHSFIIVFLALISYGLAGNIAVRNIAGIILASISLVATAVFLWLLPKVYQHPDEHRF